MGVRGLIGELVVSIGVSVLTPVTVERLGCVLVLMHINKLIINYN